MLYSSQLYDKLYRVKFTNSTKFPIVIESWVHTLNGLSSMKEITVKSSETVEVISVTGEWYLHNMLSNPLDSSIWQDEGFELAGQIGKFRINVAADGKFAWFDYGEFTIKRQIDNFIFEYN